MSTQQTHARTTDIERAATEAYIQLENVFLSDPPVSNDHVVAVWQAKYLPREDFVPRNSEQILDLTNQAGQDLGDHRVTAYRLSPTEILVVDAYFPDYRDDECDGNGEFRYYCFAPENAARSIERVLDNLRAQALDDMLAPIATNWSDLFQDSHGFGVAMARWVIACQASHPIGVANLEPAEKLLECLRAGYVTRLISAIAERAPDIAQITLVETVRDGDCGGRQTYVAYVSLTNVRHETFDLVVSDDFLHASAYTRLACTSRKPSDQERAEHAKRIGSVFGADDWPACWELLRKLAGVHHGRRTFVLRTTDEPS